MYKNKTHGYEPKNLVIQFSLIKGFDSLVYQYVESLKAFINTSHSPGSHELNCLKAR